ncbi:MAG: hypothetical protein IPN77_32320 [Sandaracinaceae bacterium]|nr:hypothetical protein [Sandaracinaceae bacterium]
MPKGGGALQGIGEKFSANPATGTASLSIPIAAPTGRSGAELALSLSYDSGAGNGPFGVGFRLSTAAVARKTEKGIPRYIDDGPDADTFVLAGAEDLVPAVGEPPRETQDAGRSYLAWRYRPRLESAFSRIERWVEKQTNDAHWRVTTRDNVTSVYGLDAASRIQDPRQPLHVFSWLLTKTEDDRGNVTRYEYKAEDGAGVNANSMVEASRFADRAFMGSAQRYLKRIHHGSSPATPTGFLFEVVFDYGEHLKSTPDDPIDLGPSGPMHSRATEAASRYAPIDGASRSSCITASRARAGCLSRAIDGIRVRRDLVSHEAEERHAQRAHKGNAAPHNSDALPRLDLVYSELELHDAVKWLDPTSLVGAEAGLAPGIDTWVDLDGEGLPGLLRTGNGPWDYKRNLGDGHSLCAGADPVAAGVVEPRSTWRSARRSWREWGVGPGHVRARA